MGKKRAWRLSVVGISLILLGLNNAEAHFQVLWPTSGNGYGQRGRPITWHYFWGHPYEKIIFDTQRPKVYIVRPDGQRDPVEIRETETKDEETGLRRRTFQIVYTPTSLGDSYLCLEAPPYFIPEEGLFWKDYVKQCLHVRAERGWERPVGMEMEIVPLTRPYGMEEGAVFKGQVLYQGKPLANAEVEIEKFNGFYVKEDALPLDPYGQENLPLITKVSRTDLNGYLTYTLDEPGWWIISVRHRAGLTVHEGKRYPLEKRAGFWLYIEKRFVQPRP